MCGNSSQPLTSKVLAVEVRQRAGGPSQQLQHLHVPASRGQVHRCVALAVGEIDRGSGLDEHLYYVRLSGDDGQVQWSLGGGGGGVGGGGIGRHQASILFQYLTVTAGCNLHTA